MAFHVTFQQIAESCRNAKLRRKINYRANELVLFLRIVKDVYDT